jgi:hypothetical protein
MDAISEGIRAYRVWIDDLPGDVTEAELKAEVVPNLRHARNGASIQSLTLDIAVGLTNRLEIRTLSAHDCENLAQTITEIATSRT